MGWPTIALMIATGVVLWVHGWVMGSLQQVRKDLAEWRLALERADNYQADIMRPIKDAVVRMEARAPHTNEKEAE